MQRIADQETRGKRGNKRASGQAKAEEVPGIGTVTADAAKTREAHRCHSWSSDQPLALWSTTTAGCAGQNEEQMMRSANGGPAFPVPGLQHDEDFNGMSLRDYFAAQALTGLITEPVEDGSSSTASYLARRKGGRETIAEVLACGAYALADAMLAERAK